MHFRHTLQRNAIKLVPHLRIVASTGALWLIPKIADCGGDQHKRNQRLERKQRQSASEGIVKKVKGDDAERRPAKQWQRMANHAQST